MNLLLDTHALIWAANDPEKLPSAVRSAIEDPDNHIWISAVSAIEVAIKFRIGKLEGAVAFVSRLVFQAPSMAEFFEVLDAKSTVPEKPGAHYRLSALWRRDTRLGPAASWLVDAFKEGLGEN